MRKERKHYTAEEKVAILKAAPCGKVPVSDLCEEVGLRPTVFYRWQKEFFENGAAAFQAQERPHRQVEEKQKRIELGEEGADQRRSPGRTDGGAHGAKKKSWGTLTGSWVPHDVRDQVMDFVRCWSEKAEIGVGRFIAWLGVTGSKFYDWQQRYGCVNEHNGWIPRDFWLELWEKEVIIDFHLKKPLEGYRRLTFMMLDAGVVAVSPASVWRVLQQAGLLSRWKGKPSRKGTGFEQPLQPHQHWHIDVSYINLCGTFYYLCSILDGYSRSIVHWDLRESMKEADIEVIRTRQGEVSGGQTADDFRQRTAAHRSRFQGVHSHLGYDARAHLAVLSAVQRKNRTLAPITETGVIWPLTPLTLDEARRLIQTYVDRYNTVRLHSAIGYVTPQDMLLGHQAEIYAERDRKLEQARRLRQLRRNRVTTFPASPITMTWPEETEAGSARRQPC